MTRTGKGNTIKREDLALLASDEDVSLGMVYAAAGMHPGIRFVREHEIAFAVCTGKCQMWGAFGLVDELLEKADVRTDADQPSFDVIPQGCLNICDEPPAIIVATPDGNGALPRCTSGDIDEALGMIFGTSAS
jgi:NADH:ubiquinone oxidoreductase subunit E